jgi:hypothetical protein
MDMLARFFVNDRNNSRDNRRHFGGRSSGASRATPRSAFWRWVCSWARAIRKPSDLGFDDGPFALPPLASASTSSKADACPGGVLFDQPAGGRLYEEREERGGRLRERCERVAELVATGSRPSSGATSTTRATSSSLIPGAVQVARQRPDEAKEEARTPSPRQAPRPRDEAGSARGGSTGSTAPT